MCAGERGGRQVVRWERLGWLDNRWVGKGMEDDSDKVRDKGRGRVNVTLAVHTNFIMHNVWASYPQYATIQPSHLMREAKHFCLANACSVQYRTNRHPRIHLPLDPAGGEWCWGHCVQAHNHAHMHWSLHSASPLLYNFRHISAGGDFISSLHSPTLDMYLCFKELLRNATFYMHTFMASLFVPVASSTNSWHLYWTCGQTRYINGWRRWHWGREGMGRWNSEEWRPCTHTHS